MAKITRRDFLKHAAISSAAVASAHLLKGGIAEAAQSPVNPPSKSGKSVPVVAPVKGHIVVSSAICAGCLTCNVACSVYKEGVVSLTLSRIQVIKDELGGYVCEPAPCLQCDGPECLYACPTGALHLDSVTGARVIDSKACIGCKRCIAACPATPSRIRFNADKKISVKCDLCGGEPRCVKFCPTGAITYEKTGFA